MPEHLETRFLTTPWTMILDGGETTGADRPSRALVKLCEGYRYPIYAFIRKRCGDPEQAADLCQSFFVFLVEKKIYRSATPERGKFRTFLLSAVKNFLSNEYRNSQALKRGGKETHISIDADDAEATYTAELPDDNSSPESLFDREWANSVFDRVWCRLQDEYEKKDQLERFQKLRHCLTASDANVPYLKLGAEIGLSENGVKTAVSRMRERFRYLFRATVAQLVENPNSVDEEITYLMEVMVHNQS